jgi:polynucleotide 5'-hydroxyl-kinase GRC3/NOL9
MMAEIDIPPSWEDSVERLVRAGPRRIMVLGATDCGKSTYCRFSSHRLMQSGFKVTIVDVGQKDIGPPAAITSGLPEPSDMLGTVAPSGFYFVGAVTPVRHLLPMVVGAKQLVDFARATTAVINTTGLIHGIGRVLKGFKIEAVRPDAIVAIQRSYELEALLRAYRYCGIIRIAPSDRAVSKTPEQRRAARERAFNSYFRKAGLVTLDIRKVIFQRSLLFNGIPVATHDFLHLEKTWEGTLAVSQGAQGRQDLGSILIEPGFEENLLCGTANRANFGTGLAIIRSIDFTTRAISLITPVAPEKIKIIQFGDSYLASDGRELDRKRPGSF